MKSNKLYNLDIDTISIPKTRLLKNIVRDVNIFLIYALLSKQTK